jgi:hypothetical protein
MKRFFLRSDGTVDTEALVTETKETLTQIKQKIELVLNSDKGQRWLNELTNILAFRTEGDKEELMTVKKQLSELPEFCQQWIDLAVANNETFIFFVRTKAQEIFSNDTKKDYYLALYIRHDQLVALIRVLTNLTVELERLVELPVSQVIKDPIFYGLVDYALEKQIYLEAEAVYKTRQKVK